MWVENGVKFRAYIGLRLLGIRYGNVSTSHWLKDSQSFDQIYCLESLESNYQ
jgi:hypothetical protein